jgi:hypothetical protein
MFFKKLEKVNKLIFSNYNRFLNMNKNIRKLLPAFLVLLLPVNACNTEINTVKAFDHISTEIKKVTISQTRISNIKTGAEVKIQINSLGFNQQAYSDAVQPKTNADVQAYWIFLTDNYLDPFAPGANVSGPIKKFNKSSAPDPVVFNNIPNGGPYWAVASAYDGVIGDPLSNNITEPDTSLNSLDKKWRRSANSVSISGSTATYSDATNSLSIALYLKFGVPAAVDTSFSVNLGNQPPSEYID